MANGVDDDAPGAWNADLERRLRVMEQRSRSGRLTVGRFVIADENGLLVVTNTVTGAVTTIA